MNIESRPAVELVRRYRGDKALIYLDPPYLPAARSTKSRKPDERYHTYAVEMTVDDHRELLAACSESDAMIVLSGYPDPLYDDLLPSWTCRRTAARAHRNSPRTECLWLNPPAVDALSAGPLFAGAAA